MYQVKIFVEETQREMEMTVNHWLEKEKPAEILSMKFITKKRENNSNMAQRSERVVTILYRK